jgi:ankyrin repeat protein
MLNLAIVRNQEFFEACEDGNLELVVDYLQKEYTLVDCRSINGNTGGSLDAAMRFAERAYQLCSFLGLSIACENEREDVLQYLIARNADCNAKNHADFTPLDYGRHSSYLILTDATFIATFQQLQMIFAFLAALLSGRASIVKVLLDSNVRMDVKVLNTALLCASRDDSESLVALLIKYKANVNMPDTEGNTPLLHACINGSVSMAELLLNHNAEINMWGDDNLR